MSAKAHDVTSEDLPTLEPTTREKLKRVVAVIVTIVATLLLINKLVLHLKQRKIVTVTVAEKHPWTETPASPELCRYPLQS